MAPRNNNSRFKTAPTGPTGTRVEVRDNNIGQALRILKKKLTQEGVFKELRERQAYEKPSMKRKKAKAAARKRHLKELAKKDD